MAVRWGLRLLALASVAVMATVLLALPAVEDAKAAHLGARDAPASSPAGYASPEYVPGQVLVQFSHGVGAKRRHDVVAAAGARKVLAHLGPRGGKNVLVVGLVPGVSVESALARLRRIPEVQIAEPNYLRQDSAPNDPHFGNQWGLLNSGQVVDGVTGRVDADIDADVAWFSSEGAASNPVTVAVIDSGIDANHPDLAGALWQNSRETAGNGVDDDGDGYVDDVNGYNFAGISQTYSNAIWTLGRANTNWIGETLYGTGQPLTQVTLLLRRVGTPTGNLQVVVRDSLAGSDLASATLSSTDVGTTGSEVTATLSTAVTLSAKTYYLLVRSTSADAANYYQIYGNSDSQTNYRAATYRDGSMIWWDGTASTSVGADDLYFVTNANSNPRDDNGHGTHVSGIIGARIDNATGIAGVAYGARIMVLKAGTSSGQLRESDIIEALHFAADHGARIINMSFGGSTESALEKAAIDYAVGKGVALFAAAGNDGDQTSEYPASFPNVTGVGATTNLDTRATFSNFNDSVDVSAPGAGIYSTMPTYTVSLNSTAVTTDYAYLSGTSMATPMVAGLAALVLSRNPDYTGAQVTSVIENGLIDDLGPQGRDTSFGAGRVTGVNLANLVSAGNNRVNGGAYLPDSTVTEGLSSDGDRNDIFGVYAAAGQRIRVSLTAPATTDFDLYLYPPGTTDEALAAAGAGAGPAVATALGAGYPASFTYVTPAGAGGTYFLRVNARSGTGTYILDTAVAFADNEIPGVAAPASPISGALGFYIDENDVYSLDLAAGQQIMAALNGAAGTDFDLYLYPPGSNDFGASPVASSTGATYPERFKYVVPPGGGGTYYLRAAMTAGSFDGAYTLTYSVGVADVTPPVTTLTLAPAAPDGDNGWYRTTPTLSLVANEAASTFIQWNGTAAGWWSPYVGPFGGYQGDNTIYYYSTDLSENQETVRSAAVPLDLGVPTNPAMTSSSHETGVATRDATVDVALSGATDPVSGVDGYSVAWTQSPSDAPDAVADFKVSAGLITSLPLADGAWYLHLRTRDVAGNWSAAAHAGPFVIATPPPVSVLAASPSAPDGADGWYVSRPRFTLSQAGEPGTGFVQWDATLDGGWRVYDAPFAGLEGLHTLNYYSEDALGNPESVRSLVVKTDLTAPSAPVLSVSGGNATTAVLAWAAASDAASGVAGYRVYDADASTLLGTVPGLSYSAAGLTTGTQYRFQVKALDVAGRESAASNTVTITPLATGNGVTATVGSVGLTFSSIVAEGGVTVSTSTTPPADGSAFQLAGVYYDLATTAGYAGAITVTLPYDPATAGDPQTLRLYHYDTALDTWVDVTTSVDTLNHTVTGRVTSFSWFAAGRPVQVFGGFTSPLSLDGVGTFKLGPALPVKFSLADLNGTPVGDAVARIYLAKIANGIPGTERPGTSTGSRADNLFRYSASDGRYVFNLDTRPLNPGLWRIRVALASGISYEAMVTLLRD